MVVVSMDGKLTTADVTDPMAAHYTAQVSHTSLTPPSYLPCISYAAQVKQGDCLVISPVKV